MGQLKPIDAARELDRKAKLEGWPFRCDATLEFERSELNEMRDLWRSLAAGKPAPSRADNVLESRLIPIDPSRSGGSAGRFITASPFGPVHTRQRRYGT